METRGIIPAPTPESIRASVGELLRQFREDAGLTKYRVAKEGDIGITQVTAIESGSNVTLDVFYSYIKGCNLYMYFAPKGEGRKPPHDFDDLWTQHDNTSHP